VHRLIEQFALLVVDPLLAPNSRRLSCAISKVSFSISVSRQTNSCASRLARSISLAYPSGEGILKARQGHRMLASA